SPMLYSIYRGNVPEYAEGTGPLVYLVSTIERLIEVGCTVVTTDRNAVLGYAEFRQGLDGLDGSIDWPLMRATMWNDIIDEPDRCHGQGNRTPVQARLSGDVQGLRTVSQERSGRARQDGRA